MKLVTIVIATMSLASLNGCWKRATRVDPAQKVTWFSQFRVGDTWTFDLDSDGGVIDSLSPRERNEQLRDWLIISLVSVSGSDSAEAARALTGVSVWRSDADPSEWARQPRGGSRAVVLPKGEIVVIVTAAPADTRDNRVAAALDELRFEQGPLSGKVNVFDYSIKANLRQAEVRRFPTVKAETYFGSKHGYHTARVLTSQELQKFLESVDHLTTAKLDAKGLVLQGRADHTRAPRLQIKLKHVAEIYQADRRWRETQHRVDEFNAKWSHFTYTTPEEGNRLNAQAALEKKRLHSAIQADGPRPEGCGFSLDPQPENAVSPLYQKARYICDLAGTEAGMILFYTDLLAKLWALDFEGSFPSQITDFQPITRIRIPERYKADIARLSRTRIWFGPRRGKFSLREPDALTFARVCTRVFAKSSSSPGKEEEQPNASSAAFVNWWNAHYGEIAFWEPEYQRLNQIQKWSLLVVWLEEQKSEALSFLDRIQIEKSNWFPDWARNQARQTFRKWPQVQFEPKGSRGESTETLEILESKPFDQFGKRWRISGGVVLAEREDIGLARQTRDADPESRGQLRYEAQPDGSMVTTNTNGSRLAVRTNSSRRRVSVNASPSRSLDRLSSVIAEMGSGQIPFSVMTSEGIGSIIRKGNDVFVHRHADRGYVKLQGQNRPASGEHDSLAGTDQLAGIMGTGDYLYIRKGASKQSGFQAEIRNRGPPPESQSIVLAEGSHKVRASRDPSGGLHLARDDLPDALLSDPEGLRHLAGLVEVPGSLTTIADGKHVEFARAVRESPQALKTELSNFARSALEDGRRDLRNGDFESAIQRLEILESINGQDTSRVELIAAYLGAGKIDRAADLTSRLKAGLPVAERPVGLSPSEELAWKIYDATSPGVRPIPISTPDGVKFLLRMVNQTGGKPMDIAHLTEPSLPVYLEAAKQMPDWDLAVAQISLAENIQSYLKATRIALPAAAARLDPVAIETRNKFFVRATDSRPFDDSSKTEAILAEVKP